MLFRAIKRHFSTTDHFAQHFKSTFPVHRKRPIRAVGREAEYPVVWKDGTAADVRLLLSTIAEKTPGTFKATHESAFDRLLTSQDSRHLVGLLSLTDGGTELTLEVGWGTIEIGTPVCENLFELQRVYESALSLVVESAQSLGMHVLGYGIHPRTAPTLELLSPKARYSVLKKVIGQDWLSFTVSASDQLHVDVSRDEMVDVLNVSNMLSSVVIAMCGNSSVYAGQQSAFSSSREGLMSSMPRHGMPSKPFRSVEDYIDRVCDLPFMMRPTNRGWVSVGGKTFREYASEHGADWASFLAHDHYVWHVTFFNIPLFLFFSLLTTTHTHTYTGTAPEHELNKVRWNFDLHVNNLTAQVPITWLLLHFSWVL